MKYSNCAKCGCSLQDFSMAIANKHFDPFSKPNYILGSINISLCWTHRFGNPSLKWCHSRVLYHQQPPSPASHAASSSFPAPYLHPATELTNHLLLGQDPQLSSISASQAKAALESNGPLSVCGSGAAFAQGEAPTHPPQFSSGAGKPLAAATQVEAPMH